MSIKDVDCRAIVKYEPNSNNKRYRISIKLSCDTIDNLDIHMAWMMSRMVHVYMSTLGLINGGDNDER